MRVWGCCVVVLWAVMGCGPPPAVEHGGDPEGVQLSEHHWYPENRERLNALLEEVAATDFEAPVTAVFDWDNTSIFHDIGESTFRYQLDQLAFRLSPEALEAHLPSAIGEVVEVEGVSLAGVKADIVAAYRVLWPSIESGAAESVLGTPEHLDFRAKLAWLYVSLTDSEVVGATYSYPWLTGLLAGYRPEEVQGLAREAVRYARAESVEKVTWTSASAGEAGELSFVFKSGLCPQPEMMELMEALEAVGVEVFVVTASLEQIVEGAAAELGYPVGEEDIFGMRLTPDAEGVLTREMLAGYPITYRPGKVEVIEQHLPGRPLVVAGDSNTDFEMLTGFEETRLRIVINRNKSGDIRGIYGDPATLLQGRDENQCRFQPLRETTPVGKNAPAAL